MWVYGLANFAEYHKTSSIEAERNLRELSCKVDREIKILRTKLEEQNPEIDDVKNTVRLLQDSYQLMDDAINHISRKMKSRASKKITRELGRCIKALHNTLSTEIQVRKQMQRILEDETR